MKVLKGISMAALMAVMLVSCKQTSNQPEESAENVAKEQTASNEISGTLQKATFQVEGMSCAVGCAKVIEGKLAKMEGVTSATVDFETKTATVEFDDAKQNPETIKTTVEEIADGAYTVENMAVEKDLAMLDQDDKSTSKKSCCSKDGKKSCGDKKSDKKDKKGCCSKDKKDKTTTKTNVM